MSRGTPRRPRSYRMNKRASQVDETKSRIVEATVDLHMTVGPAATTIMSVAQHAGVTRATVYRHFRDEVGLIDACSAYWLARHHPPDPTEWEAVADPIERLRLGLGELYAFYRSGAPMLQQVYRDFDWLPEHVQVALRERALQAHSALLGGWPRPQREGPLLSAIVGHAADFRTWRSLCCEFGLPESAAVEVMVGAALAVTDGGAVAAAPDSGLVEGVTRRRL